ncbi:tail fiber domain-containing protein [Tardibacter chloracetimidivorans]|uniref:tail fiber domain-containing protein n=1 Tax=Tardibacter chloracetimidivorans TaxID=1921510 RepID=UPI0013012AC6|nr:tail fiber domain-containing protein [Tardibacter chloracetimidivorans]
MHVQKLEQADVAIKITNETTGHDTTDGLNLEVLQNGSGRLWQLEASSLIFGTDDTARLTIGASGTVTVDTDLSVAGDIDATGDADITGNTTVGGTLDVTGDSTLTNLSLSGTLGVTGATTLGTAEITTADINGGTIDNTNIGATTPGTGAFSTLSATGQITSTLSTGTAPLAVSSTTKVTNLNADLLDGADWASPQNIGTTTPGSGAFTTLTATGNVTFDTSTLVVDAANDRVGIGIATPATRFEVKAAGADTWAQKWLNSSGVQIGGLYQTTAGNGLFDMLSSGVTTVRLNSESGVSTTLDVQCDGSILAGVTSSLSGTRHNFANASDRQLVVRCTGTTAGKFWIFGHSTDASFTIANQGGAGVTLADGATSWASASDERLKKNIASITGAVAKVAALRAVTFHWNAQADAEPKTPGVIAQDVLAVLPEAVVQQVTDDFPEGLLSVKYSELVPLLVAAVQELSARVEALETP